MNIVLHKNNERGKGDYGWLKTRYSFSFADWYDASKMGFGALRVLNDDVIAPSSGFGMHGHKNMEIITVVMEGVVSHKDSMGNSYDVTRGEVQVMSAGTGVMHSEYNHGETESLELFQIWIQPKEYDIEPRYGQRSFAFKEHKNAMMPLVGEGTLTINQDAFISYGTLESGHASTYTTRTSGNGVYLFVITGSLSTCGELLLQRDALSITDSQEVHVEAKEDSQFLIIEIPMK